MSLRGHYKGLCGVNDMSLTSHYVDANDMSLTSH